MKYVFTFLAFVLMSSGFAQVPDYVPADGLVAWYPLDGNALDEHSGQLHGDASEPIPTDNRNQELASALFFDGANDRITLPNFTQTEFGLTHFSVNAWVFLSEAKRHWVISNYKTANGNSTVLALGSEVVEGEAVLHVDIRHPLGDSNFLGANSIELNEWHMVSLIRNGDMVTLFLDGEEDSISELALESSDLRNGWPFHFGMENGNGQFWHGRLDDIGLWDRALSTEEIQTLYYGFPPILGCTDMLAGNFNPDATIDNGTCQYCTVAVPEIVSSFGETAVLSAPELASNVSWSTGEEGQQIVVSESGFYSSEWTLELSGVDSALGFVEPNAWMSIPSLALPEEYSLQVWAHFPLPETSDGHNTFFSDWNSGGAADLVQLLFHESCGLGVGDQYEQGNCGPSGMYGTGVLASDVSEGWHLITASSTPAGTTFFIDDVEVGNVNHQVSGPIVAVGNNAGGNGVAPQQAGVLSQARIWGGAMTSEHVVNAFHCNTANIELELLAHWALDNSIEGGIDLSGGGYSGTLQNVSSPVVATYCFSCETKEWAVDFPEPNCGAGTVWNAVNEECVVANPSDTDFDGCVSMTDLLDLLTVFGTCAETESEPELGEWSCGDPLEYQGYDYETVQIGEQCWFAENLQSENYENGDPIASNLSDGEWESTDEGAVAVYGEDLGCSNYSPEVDSCDPIASLDAFGRLYNWFAVEDARSLCPSGWHVPSDSEWMEFELWLGMSEEAANDVGYRGTDEGLKLKSTTGWYGGGDGSNAIGFSALSGGYRSPDGVFDNAGYNAYWWNSSSVGENSGFRYLDHAHDRINRNFVDPRYGCAMRCIQDSE